MNQYFIIYKPYQVLSQFSAVAGKKTLASFFDVPRDVYPVGRLDHESEGLLILTNDRQLNHRLLDPKYAHEREYWVQVDGSVNEAALQQLEKGVSINIGKDLYMTMPCRAVKFGHDPVVEDRDPPIRFRKNIPAPWLRIILTEGRNRQVRKMTAAVGFPTLRLIRHRIEKLSVDSLQPGEIKELSQAAIYGKLFQ